MSETISFTNKTPQKYQNATPNLMEVFVFWVLKITQQNNNNNPFRNVIHKIFQFFSQPISMDFIAQHLLIESKSKLGLNAINFHPTLPFLSFESFASTSVYDLTKPHPRSVEKCLTYTSRMQDEVQAVLQLDLMQFNAQTFQKYGTVLSILHPNFLSSALVLKSNIILIFDLVTVPATIKYRLESCLNTIIQAVFHEVLPWFAVGCKTGAVFIYDLSISPPSIKYQFQEDINSIDTISFHACLPFFATGSNPGFILYDLTATVPKKYLENEINVQTLSVSFHPKFPFVAICLAHFDTMIYNFTTLPPTLQCVLENSPTALFVVFHAHLPVFALGFSGKPIILYNIETSPPTIQRYLKEPQWSKGCVSFHPTLALLATVRDKKPYSVIIYNLNR